LPAMPSEPAEPRPPRVLIVDPDPAIRALLKAPAEGLGPLHVVHAPNLAHARKHLSRQRVDLVIVNAELPDGSGLALAVELDESSRTTHTIVMADTPDAEQAIAVIRAGADDLLTKPLDADQLRERVARSLARQQKDKARAAKVRKLKKRCRSLRHAREEVGEQVESLCSDLVEAYQELAEQVGQATVGSEYAGRIKDQLDLEELLRTTLEYLIEKLGPTNAAIFLPSTMDEYSLGGYVNYDCTKDGAEFLLEHLADVLPQKVANSKATVHVVDEQALETLLGDDAAYLADAELIAFNARAHGETLAVVTVFRDRAEGFGEDAGEVCRGIAARLGEALDRVIRIHHRAELGGAHPDVAGSESAGEFDVDFDYGDDDALPF